MAVYAGFDFGGTRLKSGLVDETGKILGKVQSPTPRAINDLLDLIASRFADLRSQSPQPIRGAGFGFPGIYDAETERILRSPHLDGLDGFAIRPALSRITDVPVAVDNDANLAALGEWKYGAGHGENGLILLTIGTGIGGGLILDGRLWRGRRGYAGEAGHMPVHPDGRECRCGSRGCLETEVSAPALVRHYRERTGSREDLTAEDIHRLARAGDEAARAAFAQAARYLGIGLGILINLLNPGKIILGGGVMTAGEYLIGPAVEEARRRSYPAAFAACTVEKAVLGNDAGLVGAAVLAAEKAGFNNIDHAGNERTLQDV